MGSRCPINNDKLSPIRCSKQGKKEYAKQTLESKNKESDMGADPTKCFFFFWEVFW